MFCRRSAVGAILAVALIAVVAAGCGGDDEQSAPEPSLFEPLEEEPAPSEPEPSPPQAEPESPSEPPPPAVPDLQVEVKQGEPIGPGSRGENVTTLQEALKELGYKPGKIDGRYGPKTREAIVAFQKDHKLGADGLVGPKTADAINTELAKAQRG